MLLDAALGSRAKVLILRELAVVPDRELSQGELARRLGLSRNTVNLAVRELEGCGAVDVHEDPGAHRVRLAQRTELARGLAELLRRDARTLTDLAATVSRGFPKDASCILFGSLARGTPGPGSDVDVLIVAASHDRAAALSLRVGEAIRRFLPFPPRFIFYTPAEVRGKRDLPLLQAIRREGRVLAGRSLEEWA